MQWENESEKHLILHAVIHTNKTSIINRIHFVLTPVLIYSIVAVLLMLVFHPIQQWLNSSIRKVIFFIHYFNPSLQQLIALLLLLSVSFRFVLLFFSRARLFIINFYMYEGIHTHTLHLYAATETISISFNLIDIYVNKNDSWFFVHVVISLFFPLPSSSSSFLVFHWATIYCSIIRGSTTSSCCCCCCCCS